MLSERIGNLTEHLKISCEGFPLAARGLLMLVGRRRRLLDYLKKKDQTRYQTLIGRSEPAPLTPSSVMARILIRAIYHKTNVTQKALRPADLTR